jgi:hypothetical protein
MVQVDQIVRMTRMVQVGQIVQMVKIVAAAMGQLWAAGSGNAQHAPD